jgi:hypothetical protein
MMAMWTRRLHRLILFLILIGVALILAKTFAQAQTYPGGFVENTGGPFRSKYAVSQINAFVPATRSAFTFPAPYNTRAYRLTLPSDCAGQDCVKYVGYSYWLQMSHVGPDLYIILSLSQLNAGPGLTLFKLTKATGVVTKVGNVFTAPGFTTEQAGFGTDGEMLYFSYTLPTSFYYPKDHRLIRYDFVAQTATTVVDITNRTATLADGSSTSLGCTTASCPRRLWAWHSNVGDTVHGGALRTTAGVYLGCLVYFTTSNTFRFLPAIGTFNECQIDRTGSWAMAEENVGVPNDELNRVWNLSTGAVFNRTSSVGNLSHADSGYEYILGQDGHGAEPSRTARYSHSTPMTTTTIHYSNSFSVAMWNHPSHQNAVPLTTRSLANQYACASNADNSGFQNEITCARVDGAGTLQQLVVAPVMTTLAATGGQGAACSDFTYCKLPKGHLDVTGRYFLWTTNLGGNRLDAFLVEVPGHLIVTLEDTTAPQAPVGVQIT